MTASARAEAVSPATGALLDSLEHCFADPRMQERKATDDARPEKEERIVGLADLCPELHAGIAASELAPFLPRDWAETVTLAKLQRFRSLLQSSETPAAHRPNPSVVADIVAKVREAEIVKRKTLWQRFRDWLRRMLLRRTAREADSGWLADWLREHSPSERVMQWTFYGVLALLFGVVAWVVYAELRAAGLFDRSGARRARKGAAPESGRTASRAAALEDADESELPSLLIAKLLEELRRLGRAQDRQSMTRRELERAVRFERADEAGTFHELLRLAERLRYDRAATATTGLRRIVDDSRRVLESLARTAKAAV